MRPVNLHFKFVSRASSAARDEIVQRLRERGARKVEPLFPGEKDEELASMQLVEDVDPKEASNLLRMLEDSDAIDYAESAAQRKLID